MPAAGWVARSIALSTALALTLAGQAGAAQRAPEPGTLSPPADVQITGPIVHPPVVPARVEVDMSMLPVESNPSPIEAPIGDLGARSEAGPRIADRGV